MKPCPCPVKITVRSYNHRRRRLLFLTLVLVCAVTSFGFFFHPINYQKRTRQIINIAFPNNFSRWKTEAPRNPPQLRRSSLNHLLNLRPFSWLMNNVTLCQLDRNSRSPEATRLLPVLVHTARQHFAERATLRKSWGSVPLYKNWDVRLVFLMGEPDPKINRTSLARQERRLLLEEKLYGDLVIGSFLDTYRNLTYKHLMGYKWILTFCPNASFVLKVDDDMFLDIWKWLDWRTEDLQKQEIDGSTIIPDLYCAALHRTTPIRHNVSKWFVSKEEWAEDHYPDYCSGWAYSISTALMKRLYSVANATKFFWIDDVFTTGMLRQVAEKTYNFTAEVKHVGVYFSSDIVKYRSICSNVTMDVPKNFTAAAVVAVPRGDSFEKDLMCLWNKTLYDDNHLIV